MTSISNAKTRRDGHAVVRIRDQAARAERPLLNRLLASRRGNVLPIVAASVLPMAAMIGGAVDMSRAYMVKSRIQQACDAGVLAGRRAMQQSTYGAAARAQAQDFFNINFKQGFNQSTNLVFSTSNPSGTSKVVGTASTTMPTAIMGMFGKETIDVAVDCEAELNLSNSDVTFVLDVTGSMLQTIPVGSGGSIVKITALRNSVMSFYDTLANAATGGNARIRYAFVPYSTNVNVGEILYDTNPQWLNGGNTSDSWNYQSRRPLWNVSTTTSTTDCQVFGGSQSVACPTRAHGTISGGGTNIDQTLCNNYGLNVGFAGFSPNPTGNPTNQTSGNVTTRRTFSRYSWGGVAPTGSPVSFSSGSGNMQCVRQRLTEVTTVTQSPTWQTGATFASWEYLQLSYPTFDLLRSIKTANPQVPLPTETSVVNSRWGGCIEERQTIAGSNIVYSGSTGITVDGSSNAHDLNIDAVPNSAATQWKPYWEPVYYLRDGSRSTACPTRARLLGAMTRTDVQTYVNSLVAVGGTYHDVGLLWGARIASPQGIFQSNVNASPGNGGSIGRHVIFMTDGELTSYDFVASMYGIERLDARVTGGSNNPTQLERQRRRYLAICESIKGKGIRLWVIAFGTTLTADLQTCASSGSSFTAANSVSLNTAFQNIAKQISELRLTK